MTREEWLTRAVEELDAQLFEGDLDILNHGYRVTWGRCQGTKMSECVQPYDGENVKLEDFFPTTISVNYTIGDPIELLGNLALECIHAFFNVKGTSKRFKALASKYYFEQPYKEYHGSTTLNDILKSVLAKVEKDCGKWSDIGKPVVFYKEPKEKKKNTLTLFCPSCGMEFKVNKKKFEKAGSKLPTCGCGAHMGIDYEDEEGVEDSTESSTNTEN